MNSLEIREAKMKLIDMINSIELPLEIKRMIISEVMLEVENATNKEIDMLFAERKKKEEEFAKEGEKDE